MRLDKYLKTARILKRREAAKQLALEKRILLNGRVAKPSSEVEIDDCIVLEFGNRILEVVVKDTPKQANKEKAALMFEVIRQEKKEVEEKPAGAPDLTDPL
ncbi:RNA-binding S4 domain-containing protein [Allobaculum sp. JKK-2023]|uniref:RNA-binding S4 domain-containing protein n=1 Tax=Allobaculum sp. JKK-2023 TaxID=3108943 RepID=UPI002B0541D7|nr:RNA-binding S4 domain-containing protein [Allobaculum sp. JKK-2023]